jgi:hypothetical protein
MQIWRRIAGCLTASILACSTLVGMEVSTAAASPGAGHTTTVVVSSAGVNAAAVPHPDHVVIAMMENHPYSNILGNSSTNPNDQDPYIRSLAAEGASFTNSYGVTHPSLPNYYAFLSGSDIVKDNTWPAPSSVDTPNLPNELATHGYSFGNYTDQGVPNQWLRYTTTPGTADHLNPIDKRLEDFPSTPAGYASLPTVSLVVGNGIQSMHDGTIAQGDAWVQSQFGTYINWARTHNSLFVLTWDEDDFTPVNHVATIFYGPMVKAGSYDQKINHYNVLRTVLDMYGLPHINHTADVSTISGAWDLSKTAHIVGAGGPCLEDQQTGEADQGGVGMWHCEDAANQQWIRYGDGTIRTQGQCLVPAAVATAKGTGIEVGACDGSSGQEWLPKTDGSLLNPASGLCLSIPGDSETDNGTQPQLQDCDGKIHQKWLLPDFIAPQLTIGGNGIIQPGSTASVTTTYTNDSSPVTLSGVNLKLTVPDGWTATAATKTTFSSLKPGQSVQTTWTVASPTGTNFDVYELSAQATYKEAPATDQVFGPIAVLNLPNGSAYCAPENGLCAFSGTRTVAYGAGATFTSLSFTGGTACTNAAFGGDPVPNTAKACYLLPS